MQCKQRADKSSDIVPRGCVVGVIGLGLVGRALARRLSHSGYSVIGYDIAEGARSLALEAGVAVLPDARAVAERTTTILLSLLTSENRQALCWGTQNLVDALEPGTLLLDTTTGCPEDIEADSRRLAESGVKLVDVCLSGSSKVIEDGRALALVGDTKDNAGYEAILKAISGAQYYFDAAGEGNRVKLIVNLVFGLNRLALAEALGLADKAGYDMGAILDLLRAGETYSVAMDTKGPKMVSGDYEPPVARLGQHAKDVHLILDYARRVGASVPVSETHSHLIDELVRNGWGDLDNAAIFKAYRR